MTRRGVFPGSFNPPTTAHLAIASAVRQAHELDCLDLVLSRVPLGKVEVQRPRLSDRVDILTEVASSLPWLAVKVTDARLIVDIAAGYDLLVLGADKWHQIQDASWYGSGAERDEAIARLPTVAVLPRHGHAVPPEQAVDLEGFDLVSSTRARQGETHLMAPEAAAFADRTGAWIDDARYDAWVGGQRPAG